MSKPYVSSIISKYGDTDKVRSDVATLNEILARQGTQLLIDVIAEYAGTTANKFQSNEQDRARLRKSLIDVLVEALDERT